MDSKRTDWIQSNIKGEDNVGFFACVVCESKNTDFYQLQVRSADEPMTSFIRCLDCGKQFTDN